MDDTRARAGCAQAGRDLQHAAWIAADDNIRRRSEDLSHLVPLQLARDLGMREVIDAGAPAATLGILDVDKNHALDRPQERARLRADPLAVRKVTGVLIHDAHWPIGPRRHWLYHLAHIADPRGEGFRPLGPERVIP